MPVALLGLLKLCLLALVYLFFVRVLWAVWSEVRTPVSAAPGIPAGAARAASAGAAGSSAAAGAAAAAASDGVAPVRPLAASHLIILAPESHRGVTIGLADEVSIGRGATCTLSLPTDTFLSSLHARVYELDGATHVEDLGSTNGTWVNDERITDPVTVCTGDRVQVGGTVLEVG